MSFTDDDLKRLKEECVQGNVWDTDILALIARLEKAEACIPVLISAHKQICDELGEQYEDCEQIIKWRESKGEVE